MAVVSTPLPARRGARVAAVAAGALLAGQVVAVVYAHGVQPLVDRDGLRSVVSGCSAETTSCTRWFAWAPNDYLVDFTLEVRTAGGVLTGQEAASRYHLGGLQWEFPVQQLQHVITSYEQTYGTADHAAVTLRYRVNGRPEQVWTWHG